MKGKVVLVTGADGGLGTYVTHAFLDAGATVIGSSRKIEQSAFASPNFTALSAEISTAEGTKSLVSDVSKRFGKLDVLAHTVGGFAGGQSIADTGDDTFQHMFDLNLNSVFYMCGRRFRFCASQRVAESSRSAVVRPLSQVLVLEHIAPQRPPWFR